MKKEFQCFTHCGETISLNSNSSFSLNDPDKVWIVQEGCLDLFLIRLKNNSPAGNRLYMFTADEHLLFGADPDAAVEIRAVCRQATKLLVLSYADLQQIYSGAQCRPVIHQAIDSWVLLMVTALLDNSKPRTCCEVHASDAFDFAEQQALISRNTVVWIKLLSGRVMLQNRTDIEFSKTDTCFPCTANAWYYAAEAGTCKALQTAQVITCDNLQQTVLACNKLALSIALINNQEAEKAEAARLNLKNHCDNLLFQRSFKKLASAMGADERSDGHEYLKEGALFATCVVVCSQCRIEIKVPHRNKESLNEIALASHFKYREVILKDQWWHSDGGPLLCYKVADSKPVAVLPVTSSRYEMYDVETGLREIITEANSKHIRPVAHTFYRPLPAKRIRLHELLKFGIESTWKSDLVILISISIAGGIAGLVVPVVTGMLFNSILPEADRTQLLQVGIFLLVNASALFIFNFTRAIAFLRIESRMDHSIQSAVWDRIISLPASFFKKYTAGDLAMRGFSINQIRKLLSGSASMSILSGITSLFNIILLCYLSFEMAKIAGLLLLVSVLFTTLIGCLNLKNYRAIAEIDGSLSGFILQVIGGIAKFKISGSEKRAFALWSGKYSTKRKFQYRARGLENANQIFAGLYPVFCAMILFFCMINAKDNRLDTGHFLAFNASFTMLITAMLALSQTAISLLSIVPVYKRTRPILDTIPEYDEHKDDPGVLRGEIEVSQISFAYSKDSPLILDDVSLRIGQGEFVALVGASGSGKSTLLRLLLGFESPDHGAIYYDGQDLSTLDIRRVRSQLGVVLQNGKVMPGDIYTNIAGGTDLPVDDAWKAAEAVGFADDIRDMPMGIHTIVSEGGSTLSGGQRQRLLIARALVNNPAIVFFNEATSALDNKTQRVVVQSLDAMMATRVIIAHRLSTIINADTIYVLDKGRIVQSGTYEELMSVEGVFKELARRQLV